MCPSHERPPGNGFTAVELIVVIALIGFLLGTVVVAIDPVTRFKNARNQQRHADVAVLLGALYQYYGDNRGNIPSTIDSVTASAQVLGSNATGCDASCTATTTAVACLDLTSSLVDKYLLDIPIDPQTGTSGNSDYFVNVLAGNHIVVGVCDPENNATISVTR
ncbi:type II secretion system protein [Patescibacteria group bacterium]|nr:type II secretion system protein [Patescibacteria group bacterium]